MRTLSILAATALLGTAFAASAAPATYKLDPTHTFVVLSWHHLGFSNPIAVAQIDSGTLVFDDKDPSKSSLEVSLPVSKITTFVPKLDEEFQGAGFFNAAQFPNATFKSTKVQALGAGKYKVTGDLSVHGVTKPVVLQATLNKAGLHPMAKVQAIGFDASGTLKRSDFGVNAYVPYVSDEISLKITTEADQDSAGTAAK